jgi:thiol:disulfide interchange protein DsbA
MLRTPVIVLAALWLAPAAVIQAAQTYTEGTDYVRLHAVQHTSVPAGKIEVMEVFSYGCPVCNYWEPVMQKLRSSLPRNAQMVYLPAAFVPAEDWPMFQRAYLAADALGIAARSHEAIYDAVWKTGELATLDQATGRLKSRQPSLADAARCYARIAGVSPAAFLAAAKSFSVDMKVRAADAQIMAMEVPGTPCIVVNGKYRVLLEPLQKNKEQLIDVVNYLVAKESN